MGRINIEIPEENHRKLKAVCALNGDVIRDFIISALDEKVKKERKNAVQSK